jgi:hypothetical protein
MDVIAARDAARKTTGYERWSTQALYDVFLNDTPRVGLWLDTSDETPEETVESVLASSVSV